MRMRNKNFWMTSKAPYAVACALIGTLAATASASDLYQGPAYHSGPYNWSGLYVGGVLGYNWNEDRTTEYYTHNGQPRPAFDNPANPHMFFDYEPDGLSGGVKAGVNFQTGSFVYGIETDFDVTDITGGFRDTVEGIGASKDEYAWQGSVRGRLGVAFDRVLVYGTGGFSYAKIKNTYTYVPLSISEPIEDVRTGWNIGAGVDYALTDNLILGLEYRYTEFEQFSNVSKVAFPGITGTQEPVSQAARMSLSYKF